MPITNRQIKEARENLHRLIRGEPMLKRAFVPMDQNGMIQQPQPMPQGAPPPGAGAMPPGDPSMGGGAPPMDPSMAAGGPPPADPNAGGPPGGDPNAGLPIIQMTANDLMQFVQELMSMGVAGQGQNEPAKPKGKQALEGKLDELASKVDSLVQAMSGGMGGGMPPGAPPGAMGGPGEAAIPAGAEPAVPDMTGAMGSGMPPKTAAVKSSAKALQGMIARMKR